MKKFNLSIIQAIVVSVALGYSIVSPVGAITFTDNAAAFNAATAGLRFTSEDFEGDWAGGFNVPFSGFSLSRPEAGSTAIVNARPPTLCAGLDRCAVWSSVGQFASQPLVIKLDKPTKAVQFEFNTPGIAVQNYNNLGLSFSAGGASQERIYNLSFVNPPAQNLGFYDLVNPFDTITIFTSTPTPANGFFSNPMGIDNLMFEGIPGTSAGNGAVIDIRSENIFGGGDVEVRDLGALHRFYVDSFSDIGPQEEFSELVREFVFNTEAGGSDPVTVHMHGVLDGLMHADTFGTASLDALLQIETLDGSVLGMDTFDLDIDSNNIEFTDVNLFEELSFEAMLTPGETYVARSRLSATADGDLNGRGFVDLRNTFEYELSGFAENPFEDPSQQTMVVQSAVPIPASIILFLGAIGVLPLFRRHV